MEPWGIMMTAVTVFGMLALTIANAAMDPGNQTFGSRQEPEGVKPEPEELKKAA